VVYGIESSQAHAATAIADGDRRGVRVPSARDGARYGGTRALLGAAAEPSVRCQASTMLRHGGALRKQVCGVKGLSLFSQEISTVDLPPGPAQYLRISSPAAR